MKAINYILVCLWLAVLVSTIGFVSAETETYKVNTEVNLPLQCTLNNAIPSAGTIFNISIYYPNGSALVNNQLATARGAGSFNYSVLFPEVADCYKAELSCSDGTYSFKENGCYKITPTGKEVSDIGQLSIGILYFFTILAIIFLIIGYLLLRNSSLWVCYTGLFMMLLGFMFVYYALHLSNIYATTIAINSGAGNVTTSSFVFMIKLLKLAPYIVAGIIAFFSIKTLRMAVNKKKNQDGWDNNEYDKG